MAEIIDPSKIALQGRVVFGASTKVEDLDSGDLKTYTIVGADESAVEKGWISCESPLGRGLIGKGVGDVARIQLPAGSKEYEIVEVYLDYQAEEVITE